MDHDSGLKERKKEKEKRTRNKRTGMDWEMRKRKEEEGRKKRRGWESMFLEVSLSENTQWDLMEATVAHWRYHCSWMQRVFGIYQHGFQLVEMPSLSTGDSNQRYVGAKSSCALSPRVRFSWHLGNAQRLLISMHHWLRKESYNFYKETWWKWWPRNSKCFLEPITEALNSNLVFRCPGKTGYN